MNAPSMESAISKKTMPVLIVFILSVLVLVGCKGGKPTEASQPTSAAATGTATPPKAAARENPSTAAQSNAVNPKPAVAEKYKRLDNPSELGLHIEVKATFTRGLRTTMAS